MADNNQYHNLPPELQKIHDHSNKVNRTLSSMYVNFPTTCSCLFIIPIGICIALTFLDSLLEISTRNQRDYLVWDHPRTKDFDSLIAAQNQLINSNYTTAFNQERTINMQDWQISLVADCKNCNLLTVDSIQQLYNAEQQVQQDLEYYNFCLSNGNEKCSENSILSITKEFENLETVTQSQIDNLVEQFNTEDNTYQKYKSLFSSNFDPTTNKNTNLLRSIFKFGAPIKVNGKLLDKNKISDGKQLSEYQKFSKNLQKSIKKLKQQNGITITPWSQVIENEEIIQAIEDDLLWTTLAMGLLFVCLIISTKSILFGFLGTLHILFSFTITLVIYRKLADIDYFSELNVFSLFFALGIESYPILIFINSWYQQHTYQILEIRMMLTFRKCFKELVSTTLTTAGTFTVIGFSPIIPISSFGYFFAILSIINFLLLSFFFPNLVVFREKFLNHYFPKKQEQNKYLDQNNQTHNENNESQAPIIIENKQLEYSQEKISQDQSQSPKKVYLENNKEEPHFNTLQDQQQISEEEINEEEIQKKDTVVPQTQSNTKTTTKILQLQQEENSHEINNNNVSDQDIIEIEPELLDNEQEEENNQPNEIFSNFSNVNDERDAPNTEQKTQQIPNIASYKKQSSVIYTGLTESNQDQLYTLNTVGSEQQNLFQKKNTFLLSLQTEELDPQNQEKIQKLEEIKDEDELESKKSNTSILINIIEDKQFLPQQNKDLKLIQLQDSHQIFTPNKNILKQQQKSKNIYEYEPQFDMSIQDQSLEITEQKLNPQQEQQINSQQEGQTPKKPIQQTPIQTIEQIPNEQTHNQTIDITQEPQNQQIIQQIQQEKPSFVKQQKQKSQQNFQVSQNIQQFPKKIHYQLTKQQKIVNCIAHITKKFQCLLFIIYLGLTATSGYFAFQLPSTTKPLQLLPNDSNIQKTSNEIKSDFHTALNSDNSLRVYQSWGIKGIKRPSKPIWSSSNIGSVIWDENFNLSSQINQQYIYDYCVEMKVDSLVLNQDISCFMLDFKKFCDIEKIEFPVAETSFINTLSNFMESYLGKVYYNKHQIGLINNKLKYISIEMASKGQLQSYKQQQNENHNQWKTHIKNFNNKASDGINNSKQTALTNWLYYLNIQTFENSILYGSIISGCFIFLIILIFTQDIILTIHSVLIQTGISFSTAAIMYFIDYQLGLIETVWQLITIGVGFGYILPLSIKYSESLEYEKIDKIKDSLNNILQPLFFGQLTTIITCCSLFFTTLQVFQKLAILVCVTVGFSLIYSLIFFPAILHLLGPKKSLKFCCQKTQ